MIEVLILKDVVDGILAYSKDLHPKESILLLRGELDMRRGRIKIEELVMPPRSIQGEGFSAFPLATLPLDLSIVGVMHSHPSGTPLPSVTDLNSFYGGLMIICVHPYDGPRCINVYDGSGRKMPFSLYEGGEKK